MENQNVKHMNKNWDIIFGTGGVITTLTLTQINQILAFCAGVLTLFILAIRACREWSHRNKPPEDNV
jgi:hypothetical protein